MVWYSYLFKNFPQFVVIHTVKGFGVVNKAEIDVFLELSCFFDDPTDVGNLISVGPPKTDRSWWKSSDKTCSAGEGNGKPLQQSCLENPMNSMKN